MSHRASRPPALPTEGAPKAFLRNRTILPPADESANVADHRTSGFFPRPPRVPSLSAPALHRAARLHERAVEELESGRYSRASVRASQATALLEGQHGVPALDRAEVLLTLARSLSAEGRLDEAEASCLSALALLARARVADAVRARCHLKMLLAQIANKRGAYGSARQLLLELRRGAARGLAKNDPIQASLCNDLGVTCKWAGRLDEAEAHYREALQGFRACPGDQRAAMANLYHNLGGLDYARGRYLRGIRSARRGLTIRERTVGADHPDAGADRAALAALLHESGQLDEAEQQYRRAISIFERAQGSDPAETAAALGNLAALCYARRDFAAAERCCRRAFGLLRKQLGAEHPMVATTLGNWAAIAARRGAIERALLLSAQAIATLEKALGPDHPTVLIHRDNRKRFESMREPNVEARTSRVRSSAHG